MPGYSNLLRTIQRSAWGLAGVLWFLWLGFEDRSDRGPMVVAAAACLALGLTALRGWRGDGRDSPPSRVHTMADRRLDERVVWLAETTLCGFGSGLLVGPLAALFMLVKVSLHDHAAPAFTGADLAGALARTPAWALVGLCLGAALGLGLLGLGGRMPGAPVGGRDGSVESPHGEER